MDKKKTFRRVGGVGHYRLFLCPTDLIKPLELPMGWGLLYFDGKKVDRVVCWKGNIFSIVKCMSQFEPDYRKEVQMLSLHISRNKTL